MNSVKTLSHLKETGILVQQVWQVVGARMAFSSGPTPKVKVESLLSNQATEWYMDADVY